jgi:hypothetical protein
MLQRLQQNGRPTQGQRDLYELTPATNPHEARAVMMDDSHRSMLDPVRSQRFWDAPDLHSARPSSVPPSNAPQIGPTQPQRDFHALNPNTSPEVAFGRRASDPVQHARYWRGLREMNPSRDPLFGGTFENLPRPPNNRLHADGGAVGQALSIARRYAQGGTVEGPILGPTGGREDAIPISVASGSYVVPADVVAACGDGNTLAGMKTLERMMGGSVRSSGVAGAPMASGGAVPIRISDGEYVVSPEQVAQIGGGDMAQGHRALDAFVRRSRAEHVKKLKSLPGPVKG